MMKWKRGADCILIVTGSHDIAVMKHLKVLFETFWEALVTKKGKVWHISGHKTYTWFQYVYVY